MHQASTQGAALRIAHRKGLYDKIPEILDNIRASAESVERIPHHRHEELFTFTDGSKLLYDHVALRPC